MNMSQSTRSKSSTMIRRRPSTPFSTWVTWQELDSRKTFSVAANCSSSSSIRMRSALPSREVQVGEGIILRASSVLSSGLQAERNRDGLLRRDHWERSLRPVADDRRRDENNQLLLLIEFVRTCKEFAEPRDVTEQRDLFLALGFFGLDEAAENDGRAVAHTNERRGLFGIQIV